MLVIVGLIESIYSTPNSLNSMNTRFRVRKNANSYSYNEWQEYRRATAIMKDISARNPNHPFGFSYQGN